MIKKSEPESEPKDVEIELLGDVIFRFGENVPSLRIPANKMPGWATRMAQEFLSEATDVLYGGEGYLINNFDDLRDYLIQILEEKFGLRVRVCINCKYCERL